jgi:hypothetical protein
MSLGRAMKARPMTSICCSRGQVSAYLLAESFHLGHIIKDHLEVFLYAGPVFAAVCADHQVFFDRQMF